MHLSARLRRVSCSVTEVFREEAYPSASLHPAGVSRSDSAVRAEHNVKPLVVSRFTLLIQSHFEVRCVGIVGKLHCVPLDVEGSGSAHCRSPR
jgi:hypothetical protein